MVNQSKLNKVFVYGTLRPGTGKTVKIPGFMYDLGWYPGVTLGNAGCNGYFHAEVINVTDKRLAQLDHYEGYREDDPEGSLYLRVPYEDGWIYTYNHSVESYPVVEGGDWLAHTQKPKGVNAQLVETVH